MPALSHPAPVTLLAEDRRPLHVDLPSTVLLDAPRRGATATVIAGGGVRRGEQSTAGPLVLEAAPHPDGVGVQVWGPASTTAEAVEAALVTARQWAGLDDEPAALLRCAGAHPLVGRLCQLLGPPRLSRMPRLHEALGRAIIGQLVQRLEAARSIAGLAARLGSPLPGGVWAWPEPDRQVAAPVWELRRCGISLRGAVALQEGARRDRWLSEVSGRWDVLDRRLRSLPGVGVWTSGETRLALGDPDAVSVGDYHLPALVGWLLTGETHRPRGSWTDAEMLALLEPFTGQRGRVVRLLQRAVRRGIMRLPARRAPRAALAAHRYW